KKLLARLGQPQFRAKQIVQWLYQKGASSYDEMSNIPASLREALEKEAPLHPPVIADKRVSSDGTRKYIIRFHDGAETEMVGIPSKDRLTVCFSTQVGCLWAARFAQRGRGFHGEPSSRK
ncbi:MAG: 23S rRNA (adenine(2503)-C(2))-methyltransferase RlmN, partial [Collinsella sp.]